MQNVTLFLRRHAYELTSLAHDCPDEATANQLERCAFHVLDRARKLDEQAAPLEP